MILDDLLEHIDSILSKITSSKLNAYALTQNRLHQIDISKDASYRRTYNGFYKVRLPVTASYDTYFNLIEQSKNENEISLAHILNVLFESTGRIETSFGSKLLATVNPDVAPLDSIVLAHLGLSLPKNSGQSNQERIQQCVDIHSQLVARMNELITLPQFPILRKRFTNQFPDYQFTDIKILDLLLWQYRP